MKSKDRLLVIDCLNQFYRSYIVDPSLSTNGDPIGGLKGFLKILQKITRETRPTEIVLCWDGEGGSRKRRALVSDYKGGRKPLRLNREVHTLTSSEELINKLWQQQRLMEYLDKMPVSQIKMEGIEADDIISYVVRSDNYSGWEKIIVASDKDFFQLCDEETILYRPVQSEVMNESRILEKYNIHPSNFAIARAVTGDKSDNLEGVPSVGLKTLAKRFPFLVEKDSTTLDKLYEYCESMESKLIVYKNVMEHIDRVKLNYEMMQLYSPMISYQTKKKIKNILEDGKKNLNRTKIKTMMIQDGFGEWNWDELFRILNGFTDRARL